jgi:hypothetical protein
MRFGMSLALLAVLPSASLAQVDAPRMFPTERLISLTAGIGNSMGWFGAQGERYLADERLSVFVGLGYTPQLDPGDPTGPTFAAGLRSFTSGIKHRAFLEGAVSQILVETEPLGNGSRLYGPGVQGGYQYVSLGGFTFMASLGLGYALAAPRGVSPWGAQIGLGAGYTWRRPASAQTLPSGTMK